MDHGVRAQTLHEVAEPLQRGQMNGLLGDQMFRPGQLTHQQQFSRAAMDGAALLEDAFVFAPLDLEEQRRLRVLVVIAHPQLKPLLLAMNRCPIGRELVGIQVQTMHLIGAVRPASAVFVWLEITTDELAHGQNGASSSHSPP